MGIDPADSGGFSSRADRGNVSVSGTVCFECGHACLSIVSASQRLCAALGPVFSPARQRARREIAQTDVRESKVNSDLTIRLHHVHFLVRRLSPFN